MTCHNLRYAAWYFDICCVIIWLPLKQCLSHYIIVSTILLFSRSVVSYSLQPHGLQHTRISCPSLSPRVCLNSYLLSQWCHPTISSSAIPFSSYPQFFPAAGSFLMSRLFTSKWPNYWSFSISPSNEYSGLISFRIDWFDLLAAQGTLHSLLQHQSSKASIIQCSAFFMVELIHLYTTTGKTITLIMWTFVSKVISVL